MKAQGVYDFTIDKNTYKNKLETSLKSTAKTTLINFHKKIKNASTRKFNVEMSNDDINTLMHINDDFNVDAAVKEYLKNKK